MESIGLVDKKTLQALKTKKKKFKLKFKVWLYDSIVRHFDLEDRQTSKSGQVAKTRIKCSLGGIFSEKIRHLN